MSPNVIKYQNNKPWITKELKSIINKKKLTYFTGDLQERKAALREVRNGIRIAKAKYREKIEMQYSGGNLHAAWNGIYQLLC